MRRILPLLVLLGPSLAACTKYVPAILPLQLDGQAAEATAYTAVRGSVSSADTSSNDSHFSLE